MANLKWRSASARCPLYIRSNDLTILCEGITPESEIRLIHRQTARCSDHFAGCCARHYRSCPIYRMVTGAEDKK